MPAIRRFMGRYDPTEFGESLRIALRQFPPALEHFVQTLQLHEPDCSLQVSHPVVVTNLVVVLNHHPAGAVASQIRHCHGMLAKPPNSEGHFLVVGGEHSTLCRSKDLSRVEAEAGHCAVRSADALASIFRTDPAGGIFDHYQAMAGSDRLNLVDGARQTDLVNQQNSAGSGSDRFFDTTGIEVVS